VDVLPELHAGDTVSDRYRLERRLGSGATAAVWQARDRELGRLVALKVLLGSGVPQDLAVRFEREGTILARLSHPNVVPVLATGNHEGRPYLVMTLVDGVPLNEVLRHGPMAIDEALDLVTAIAAGLGAAHAAGVVHRDVKPANIVCGHDGIPRLVDFGIARAADLTSITSTNVVVGTAAYLSPEQARGETPGPASDVYSLGCVLYEALTGGPPFDADNAIAVAYRHVHDAPRSPTSTRAELSPAIDTVVMRCLAKEVADRYANGAELESALERARSAQAGADTTTVAIPPVRDATMVMPAVDAAGRGGQDPIDPSPLAPVDAPPHRWGVIAAVGAAVVLLLLIAASLGNGEDNPSGGSSTDASVVPTTSPTSIVTTTAPETTLPPTVEVRIGKGKGKHGGGD
jgi:eukaryotic-like serine/threonine-protein kinase